MFQDVVHVFQDVELKFQDVEDKKVLGRKTFFPGDGKIINRGGSDFFPRSSRVPYFIRRKIGGMFFRVGIIL